MMDNQNSEFAETRNNTAVSDFVHRIFKSTARWPTWTVSHAVKDGYKKSGWVYRCVSLIARQGSTVPFVVYNPDGEIELEHPVSILLNKPHPYLTRSQVFELVIAWLQLSGSAYLKKVSGGDSDMTKELWPISPDRLAPIISSDVGKFIEAYSFIDDNGTKKRSDEYTPENMLHLRLINPANPLEGIGPLQAAARSVDLDNQQQDWNLATMQNRGVVDGVFTFKKDLDSNLATSILERIKEKFSGVKNARDPLVIGSEAKYTKMGLSAVELDFLNSRKFNREEILGIFGVPPQLMASEESSTYNNFTNAMRVFWESTVLPVLDITKDQLNHSFDDELEPGYTIGYDRSSIPALRSSESEQTETAERYWTMGVPVVAINEKLELGLSEFPGWELPWTGQKSSGDVAETVEEEGDDVRHWKLIPLEQRSAEDEAARRDKVVEGPFKTLIVKLLNDQSAEVFKALEAGEDPVQAVRSDHDKWLKSLVNATTAIAIDFAGTVVVDERGNAPTIEYRNDEVQEILDGIFEEEAWILNELSHIEDVTVNLILEQVRSAEENGLNTEELVQALVDTGTFSEARANRIARTVGGTASSVGQWAGAKASGATRKIWSTSAFEVRDIHTNREGEDVEIDNRFSVQVGDVGPRFPLDPQVEASDRINCRCFLQFS